LKNPHLCTYLCGNDVPDSHFSLWIPLSTGCGLLRASLDRGILGFVDGGDIGGEGGLLLVGRSCVL
jgi:hypothetical protein